MVNPKVFVGMSGGVDSSVVALLLKEQGYNVVGVYMKNWSDEMYGVVGKCPWEYDVDDVQKVCRKIGIDFIIYNFEREYREIVLKNFFDEYNNGRTPNPDILCNKEIKFNLFLNKALQDGAEYIATGHYARIENIGSEYRLLKGIDSAKDQSYFLSLLDQFQLSKTLFPIGGLLKTEVRKIAKENNLHVYNKKDSQGICFIGDINVSKFLRNNIAYSKGNIVDEESGKIIGSHDGIAYYTIGQRQGLSGIKVVSPDQLPYFVSNKDKNSNTLYVVKGTNNEKLFKKEFVITNLHEICKTKILNNKNTEVMIRYRQTPIKCNVIESGNNKYIIKLDKQVRAISPGQSAVFYENDICLGNGIIEF